MILLLVMTAIKMGRPAYAVLDAYFATSPAFIIGRQYCMDTGQPWIHLIIPAKKSYVAYLSNPNNSADRVKLWERFNGLEVFTEVDHPARSRLIRYDERILF